MLRHSDRGIAHALGPRAGRRAVFFVPPDPDLVGPEGIGRGVGPARSQGLPRDSCRGPGHAGRARNIACLGWRKSRDSGAGRRKGFGPGKRGARQNSGPMGVVGSSLAIGTMLGDAGGAIDDIKVGMLLESGGGTTRAVQTQGRAGAVDEVPGGEPTAQDIVSAGVVDKAAVAAIEGIVKFASGLKTGVVDGRSREEQVVDEGLLRIAKGAQGDAGAERMGLDIESVSIGAQSAD